ncbi:hypothetical protein LCGC14_2065970, partial [marine sediment metagenome]
MIRKHNAGQHVPSGTYWNKKTWELVQIPKGGDYLPVGEGVAYYRVPLLLVLALGVFAGIAMALRPGLSDDNPTSNGPTGRVVRGPLVISVTEKGELESERRKVVSNELRWPVIIKEVVAEGTLAKEGQIIIQFECKELIDAIEREELDVTTAKNNHLQATQNLLLKEKEMDNNVLKAKRALNEAKEDRKRYIEHEYPIISYEKDSAVKFAEEDLSLAEGSLKFMKEVNSRPDLESPFTKNETEAAELKVKRFENNLKKAELELKKFKEYDHKRKLRELKEKVDDVICLETPSPFLAVGHFYR